MPRTVYTKLLFNGYVFPGSTILYNVPPGFTTVVRWVTVQASEQDYYSPMGFLALRYFDSLDLVNLRAGSARAHKLYTVEHRLVLPAGQNIIGEAGTTQWSVSITGYELTGQAP